MVSRLLSLVFAFLVVVNPSWGFEVGAKIRKIDVDKRMAVVFANGQDRIVPFADDAKFFDEKGNELNDGLSSKEFKADAVVTLQIERENNTMLIKSIRLGGNLTQHERSNASGKASVGKTSVGFKPLIEMTAEDRYQGEDGGLYGGGRNEMPDALSTAAKKETAKIVPRDTQGQPTTDGKIGLVSISMSNATQEFALFKKIADADPRKSPAVTVVDCAQGGQTMARWADPKAACWHEAERRLQSAGVSHKQVQVAWVKLANAGPSGELHQHGKELERDTRTVLSNLTNRFPNLRIAYLGSRIYGGYAEGRLNPEPYAYEGAFVVRWLIQSQLKNDASLNFDPILGEVRSPLLLWGPYLWSDGMTPRKSDGLIWERSDLVADGTHPSDSGRMKVAELLLSFFTTDPYAQAWFVKQ